ncbi:hypothetical protein [Halorussus salinisoli]|uniref:hypothetical protein n=1 Tax=Halorussus salinisoli TaxID=2558242 RepID=UPI0010C1F200|nr:hypothetical protein [Halorussus salinisoli]
MDSDITFVIPRGHQNLPRSVPGSDVDVYVAADDFERPIRISKRLQFRSERTDTGGFVDKIVANPGRVKDGLLTEREKVLRLALETLTRRTSAPDTRSGGNGTGTSCCS